MSKAWHNPRQVTVHQALAEPEDARRRERLISLLATGVERLLAGQSKNNSQEPVDFQAEVSPNTCTREETAKRESA
jgi:hypothetical protein